MVKTRVLPADTGDRSDCKKYATTGVKYNTDPFMQDIFNNPAPAYYAGLAKATSLTAFNNWSGNEYLESTTRPRPHFNDIQHVKNYAHNYAYLYAVKESGWRELRSSYGTYFRRSAIGSALPNLTQKAWSEFTDTQRRAWWSMQPAYESELAMLNFIYEMKDFKHIAKVVMKGQLSDIAVGIRNLKRKLRKLEKTDKGFLTDAKQTLASITKTAAGARLVNEFAIKPLLNDLTTIFHTLAIGIEAAQSEFASRGNLNQISHFSESTPRITSGTYGTGANSCLFGGYASQSTFTATMQYSYRYKMRKGWDLMQRGLGLEVNAEVLWNAIPFSFLVDYVYKIGNAIHAMKTDPNVNMRLIQYCESILSIASNGYFFDTASPIVKAFFAPASKKHVGSLVPLSGYTSSIYVRRVTSPNKGMATPRVTNPSNGQLWNLAALLRCFLD